MLGSYMLSYQDTLGEDWKKDAEEAEQLWREPPALC